MSRKISAPSSLEIRLLGPFSIAVDGRRVEESLWARRKPKLLVKSLALQPHHQMSREQLMDLLWPELGPEAAANNLHKAIHLARHALEPGLKAGADSRFIITQDQQVLLRAPQRIRIDVDEFEQQAAEAIKRDEAVSYEAALALYAGDLLIEDLYEDWAAGRRERLRALRHELLARLARVCERHGQHQRGIERLKELIADDPSNEVAHQRLMRLYALVGSRHQALRQYRQCREALSRELDTEPDRATVVLYERIVSGQIQPLPANDLERDAAEVFARAHQPPNTRLVGRESELRRIEDCLSRALAGNGAMLFISGEAGVGKTRLALEALELARLRSACALAGACYEQEGQTPYGPFVEALSRYALTQSREALAEQLGEWAPPIARLAPAVWAKLNYAEAAPDGASPPDKQWLFAAVSGFLARLSGRALTSLFLDDLHAADEDSLALLHHLARNAGAMRLMLIGSFREEEVESAGALSKLLAALYREGLAVRLSLAPLSERDSAELITELLGGGKIEAEALNLIYGIASGHPFFTQEIVRVLREQGRIMIEGDRWISVGAGAVEAGAGLRDWVRIRLARLGEDEHKVLTCASVIGQEALYEILLAVCGLPESALLDSADCLLNAQVLDATATGFKFRHPLVRQIVYDQLSPARRALMHEQVAEVIEQVEAARLGAWVEALAHHYSLSRNLSKAVHYLSLAGDRAAAVYANELAMQRYLAAIESARQAASDRHAVIALYEKLGDVQAHVGSNCAAAESYLDAINALREDDCSINEAVERLARLRRKAAYQLILQSRLAEAEQHLRAARTLFDDARLSNEVGPVEHARLSYTWAHLYWHREEFNEAEAAARESLQAAEEAGSPTDVAQAYEALALTCLPLGDWKRGFEYERQRQSLSDLNRDIAAISDVHL